MTPKKSPRRPSLPRRVREALYEAEALLEENHQPAEARDLLEELDQDYPGREEVLELLLNAYYDLKDMHGYEWACYRLLKASPRHPEALMAMGGAYMSNIRPGLAIQAFEQFLRFYPQHEHATDARQTLEKLQTVFQKQLLEWDLPTEQALEIAALNDEVRFLMDHGQMRQAQMQAEKLLKCQPSFLPALNNLAVILAAQSDWDGAQAACRSALEIQPDNVHALSNLARMLLLSGRPAEAREMAERMLRSTAFAADAFTKKAEALSFLGDDAGVIALYRAAKTSGELRNPDSSPLLLHLAAVSLWYTGQEKEARKLWKEALKLAPGFPLAAEQLEDLEQPVGERNGPFAFPLPNWVSASTLRELERILSAAARRKDESAGRAALAGFMNRHPELISLAPHLLARGDAEGRDFIIILVGALPIPELLETLQGFSQSKSGSDTQRWRAANILSQNDWLPEGPTRLWIKGKWSDVMLLAFEISYEPVAKIGNPKARKLHEEAYEALQERRGQRAQELLEQAIALVPDDPSMLNNLALALNMQGQNEKALALAKEINTRFPDYFFGITSQARQYIAVGDLAAARDLLDKLMKRKELHISEYNTLCATQIDLHLVEKNRAAARSWLEMWEQADPEDPVLAYYRKKVR